MFLIEKSNTLRFPSIYSNSSPRVNGVGDSIHHVVIQRVLMSESGITLNSVARRFDYLDNPILFYSYFHLVEFLSEFT